MSSPRTKRRTVVVIDGNIGSGKSTQLRLLSDTYTIKCEPIHEWPLNLFYEDSERWAFLLQMSILKSFTASEDDATTIWERSPESSREVFWRILEKTKEEDDVYTYFYEKCGWTPDIHMYIRTDPVKCFERVSARHQDGDVKITLDYLEKVHESYEKYIASKGSKVTIIDGSSGTPEEIHKEILRCLRDVLA